MIVACTIFFGISCLATLLFFYLKRKNALKKQLLPQQTQLVNELISELQKSAMVFEFQDDKYFESPLKCTLFDLVKFLDGQHRLSKEKYDDYKLFFANNKKHLIDFEKYIQNPLLPLVILEELKDFRNTTFKKVLPKSSKYFKIYFPENDGTINISEVANDLYEGNEDGYDSWLSLKESAHSLLFVLEQWMNENGTTKKSGEVLPTAEMVLD